jgi:hypothetical protein
MEPHLVIEIMSSWCLDGKAKDCLSTDSIGNIERGADRGSDLGVSRGWVKPTERNPHRRIPMLEFAPADEFGMAKDIEATCGAHVSPNY